MIVLILFSFLAGIATVISPCVLPVLPAILSVSAGRGKLRPYGVIVGLIISFVFFTLALTWLVQSFGISADALRYSAILIIAFFGLVMLLPTLGDLFAKAVSRVADFGNTFQSHAKTESSGFWSGLLLGIALGLIWTPCAGPILAAITALVATQRVTLDIVFLTLAYSIGSALPLLLITLMGSRALTSHPFLVRNTELIRQGFGMVMVLTAIALAFHLDVAFQQKVLDYLPGIQIENNAWVESRLKGLRTSNPDFPALGPGPFGAIAPPSQAPSTAADTSIKKAASGPVEVLPEIAHAPSFAGLTDWINSPPLTLVELKGKVVLVDFWTYSCINCIRTLPYLKDWYQKYHDKGLVIVGVHTPEFEFEKNETNVKEAVKRFGILYPVALDNHFGTWQAYNNSYWPAHYLIDQNGIVRQFHFGEGGYLETENAIRSLLGMPSIKESSVKSSIITAIAQTPETYLGLKRSKSYSPENKLVANQVANYQFNGQLGKDQVGIKGEWDAREEYILSASNASSLTLNFMANRVYLVLGGSSVLPITVELDGKPLEAKNRTVDMDAKGQVFVKEPRKYDIVDMKNEGGRHELTLNIPKGIQVYAFTFGMEE